MSNANGPVTTRHRDGKILPQALAASVSIFKGAAAAIVLGSGLATPLRAGTATHQFVGVWGETLTEPTGADGETFTQIVRKGVFAFAQTGTTITKSSINQPVYFADDQTVTLTEGTQLAGVVAAVDNSGNVWVDIENAVRDTGGGQSGRDWVALSGAADAINPHVAANYIVTKAGVDAMTLAAPTAGTDDGLEILVSSNTANAHTITATGLLNTGGATTDVATFAAHPGAGLRLKAYNGKWQVLAAVGITFS